MKMLIILLLLFFNVTAYSQCYFHKLYRNSNADAFSDGGNAIIALINGGLMTTGRTLTSLGNMVAYNVRVDQCGDTVWQKIYDYSPSGGESSNDIVLGNNNLFYSVGEKYDPVEGASDGFIIATDSNGTVMFQKTIDIGYNDWYSSALFDNGSILVTGHFNNQIPNAGMHLTKLDSLGNIIWSQVYDTTDYIYYPKVSNAIDGGYVIAGRLSNLPLTSGYLIKVDSLGNRQWRRVYRGINGENAAFVSIVPSMDRGYLLVGAVSASNNINDSYLIKVDSLGNIIWSSNYDYKSLNEYDIFVKSVQLSDESYIVCGTATELGGEPSIRISKVSKEGNLLWDRSYSYYGGQSHDYVEDMAISPNGDIALTGYITALPAWHTTGNDMFILKVDSCGYLESDSIEADFSYSTDTTNQTIAFTNQSTAYCSSFWYFGDGDSSNLQNPVHTYGDTGTYTISLVVRAGNSLDSVSYTINPRECAHDGVTAFFQYAQDSSDIYTFSFSNQSQDYCSLKWYFGTVDSSTTTNPGYTYGDTGTYTITLIVYAGMYSDTFTQEIKIEEIGVGISESSILNSSIKIYPNPTKNILHIETKSENYQIQNIQIIDLGGKTVLRSKESPIRTTELSSGIYFYQVELSNGKVSRGKFVKQ